MVFRRNIFSKVLSSGIKADVALVKDDEGYFQAALYVEGRYIPGPAIPQQLTPPQGSVTHWMGYHPSVGLSSDEAERITREVNLENSVPHHRNNP